MKITPVINCKDFNCVKSQFEKAEKFLNPNDLIHFDISDGTFAKNITWNNPEELKSLLRQSRIKIGASVHLMVDKPGEIIEDWLLAGVKSIAVHLEFITNPRFITNICFNYGAEPILAVAPETPIEKVVDFTGDFRKVLLLAVDPGLSGQGFQETVLERIKFLKNKAPDVIIEVDGGINLETAKLVKEAGADVVLSGSYIFNNSNSQKAYESLKNI